MTRKSTKPISIIINSLLLFLSGLSLGWLIGLSISPVLHIVVGSIIALIAGIVGALTGLQYRSNESTEDVAELKPDRIRFNKIHIPISPLPLTVLMIGLGGGASLGIYVRTNDFLGPDPQRFARKWSGTGLSEGKIQERLFNQLHPPLQPSPDSEETEISRDTSDPSNSKLSETIPNIQTPPIRKGSPTQKSDIKKPPSQYSATLFTTSVEDCDFIRLYHKEELRNRLETSTKPEIRAAAKKCKDDDCLEALKELICANSK